MNPKRLRETTIFLLLLVATSALGIARISITPIWANPEEPGHFEYVRYIAEHNALPSADQRDDRILTAIADSIIWYVPAVGMAGPMANSHVYAQAAGGWITLSGHLSRQPGYTEPGFLGTPQLTEHPSYYSLAALSQFLVIDAPVETQVRASRFVSLILGLLILCTAYLTAQHLFPDKPELRIGTVAAIAVFPNFMTMATAVHNQVMAALAVALVLYVSVRLIRRGLHAGDLVWLALCVTASAMVKVEAWIGALSRWALYCLPAACECPGG